MTRAKPYSYYKNKIEDAGKFYIITESCDLRSTDTVKLLCRSCRKISSKQVSAAARGKGCSQCPRVVRSLSFYESKIENIGKFEQPVLLEPYSGCMTPAKATCKDCLTSKKATLAVFADKTKGCPVWRAVRLREQKVLTGKTKEEQLKAIPSITFRKWVTGYERKDSKCEVECKTCRHIWTPACNNLIAGASCPCCSGRIFEYLYIQRAIKGDVAVLKLGVTNNPRARLRQQNKSSSFSHEFIRVYRYEDKLALDIERALKIILPVGVVPKDEMSVGFTETVDTKHLDKIINIINRSSREQEEVSWQ